MIRFLTKLLIKDYENTTSPSVREAYGILCGSAGIFLNLLLFCGKFFAGTISSSISITADAFNNLSDAGSSLITLIGFRMSGQEADTDHPFGHGRIEYISGLLVSIAILLMAVELIRSSVDKILHPSQVDFNLLIVVILIFSIGVKCYMCLYNKQLSGKINSAAMKAASTDSLSDALATTAVLLAAIFTHFTGITIDGYCGVLVGCFILYAGYCSAKDTISPLLGQPPEPETVSKIEEIALSYDGILGIHDLVVHNYGPGRLMVSLHVEVPASGDILFLHDTIDLIERELRQKLSCEAVIHMDPILMNDPLTNELKGKVILIAKNIDPSLNIHDFRIVQGPTHTNIIFDIVIPLESHLDETEVKERINTAIQEIDPSYFTVIEVDHFICK